MVRTADLRVGDRVTVGRRTGTVTGLEPGPRGTLLITVDGSDLPLVGWPTSEWSVHRGHGHATVEHPARSEDLAAVLVPVVIVASGILIVLVIILTSV